MRGRGCGGPSFGSRAECRNRRRSFPDSSLILSHALYLGVQHRWGKTGCWGYIYLRACDSPVDRAPVYAEPSRQLRHGGAGGVRLADPESPLVVSGVGLRRAPALRLARMVPRRAVFGMPGPAHVGPLADLVTARNGPARSPRGDRERQARRGVPLLDRGRSREGGEGGARPPILEPIQAAVFAGRLRWKWDAALARGLLEGDVEPDPAEFGYRVRDRVGIVLRAVWPGPRRGRARLRASDRRPRLRIGPWRCPERPAGASCTLAGSLSDPRLDLAFDPAASARPQGDRLRERAPAGSHGRSWASTARSSARLRAGESPSTVVSPVRPLDSSLSIGGACATRCGRAPDATLGVPSDAPRSSPPSSISTPAYRRRDGKRIRNRTGHRGTSSRSPADRPRGY